MRILHVITSTEVGGAQKVCIDLCCSAVNEGHIVGVASMEVGYIWQQLPNTVLRFKLKHLVKPIRPWKDILTYFELKKVVKSFDPDIVHLHSSKAGILGRLACLNISKHVVYTVHGFDSIRLKYRIFLPIERIMQRFTGAIVGVSDYDCVNLKKEGITKNVSTIYNGIDEGAIIPEKQFPQPQFGKIIIMTIARISPPKDFQMFLDVAKYFDGGDYVFVWVGGSPEYSLDEVKKQYEIPANVYLMGNVQNASRFIGLCDLFVLFSKYEGLPMVIIEAMSQKKAIVASNVGGISELVDSNNGSIIENDIETAADAIKKIMSNNAMRIIMGEKSYEKYRSAFTLDKMWNEYKDLYCSLLYKSK